MKMAADLLRGSLLTMKEVAFRVGARDMSHFMRDFKKVHGLSPKKFRDGNVH